MDSLQKKILVESGNYSVVATRRNKELKGFIQEHIESKKNSRRVELLEKIEAFYILRQIKIVFIGNKLF